MAWQTRHFHSIGSLQYLQVSIISSLSPQDLQLDLLYVPIWIIFADNALLVIPVRFSKILLLLTYVSCPLFPLCEVSLNLDLGYLRSISFLLDLKVIDLSSILSTSFRGILYLVSRLSSSDFMRIKSPKFTLTLPRNALSEEYIHLYHLVFCYCHLLLLLQW